MPPTRLQRNGATLDEVRDAVRAEFGAGARIVAAETRHHARHRRPVPTGARRGHGRGPRARRGADRPGRDLRRPDEAGRHRRAPRRRRGGRGRIAGGDGTASTRADAFASVLDGFVADGITRSAPRPAPALRNRRRWTGVGSRLQAVDALVADTVVGLPGGTARPVPAAVRSADGDLVLLVGRPNDVDAAAASSRPGTRSARPTRRTGGAASWRAPRACATATRCSASRRGTTRRRSTDSRRTRCGSSWTSAEAGGRSGDAHRGRRTGARRRRRRHRRGGDRHAGVGPPAGGARPVARLSGCWYSRGRSASGSSSVTTSSSRCSIAAGTASGSGSTPRAA